MSSFQKKNKPGKVNRGDKSLGENTLGVNQWGYGVGAVRQRSRPFVIRHPFFTALGVFIILRIWFALLGIVGITLKPIDVEIQIPHSESIILELESTNFQRLFLSPWYRFDTVHYLEIAADGYTDNSHNSAYPPLFPALIGVVNWVVPSMMGSAMLVSNLAGIICLWLFIVLIRDQFSDSTAHKAVYWLAVFPTTFLLFQPYTESLFMALLLASLITIRRKKWGWAALFAGLATLTRYQGILITVVFIWEGFGILRQQKLLTLRREWVIPLAASLTPTVFFAAHLVILKYYFHAALPWEAVSFVWGEKFGWPWAGFIGTVREMIADPVVELQVGRIFNLIGALFVPVTLIATRKKVPVAWQLLFWLFYLSSVAKLSNAGAFYSAFRYFLPIFPMYLFLADVLANRKARLAGIALCLPAQAGLLIMFYLWIWVF